MRLRLDKLVLSAGLALAMVATTIPVGAATGTQYETAGFSVNGKTANITSDDETFGAAYEVESTLTAGDWTGTKKSVVAKIASPSNSNTELTSALASSTSNISLDLKNNNLTPGAVTAFGEKPVTISTTYDFSINKQYQWKADSATDMSADDIQAALEAKYATYTYETLQTALGTGYKVSDNAVSSLTVAVAKTDVVVGEAPDDENTKGTIASCTATVVGSFTAVVQTSSDKLADGYAYDIVQEKLANTSYVIYEFDPKTGVFSQVTTSDVKTTGDKDAIKYSLTDLTKVYMVASKPESTSSALLFGDDADGADSTTQNLTVSDTLTVELGAANDVSADQKKTFTDLATANGLKVGAYFDATLKLNGNATDNGNAGKLVEINIVKPSDIEALAGEGKTIKYTVLMQHGDMDPVALETITGSKYITFSSQYFSTFALAYEIVDAETPAEDPTQEEQQSQEQQQESATTPEGSNGSGGSSSENGASSKTADNSMMPLFMTTLLLALCAGSLAIYKEKKTN